MPSTPKSSDARSGTSEVATVSAVADFVIKLSIAERSHLIYGLDHPIARRTREQVLDSLSAALELQAPIVVHFSREAIFCGEHCLERDHPIYRRLAEKMWQFGVSGVWLEAGVGEDDLGMLIEIFSSAVREKETRAEIERRLEEATFQNLRVELLKDVVTYRERGEVEVKSREEQERLWERLVRRLAGLRERFGDEVDVVVEGEPIEGVEEQEDVAEDYAEAVIDYLRQVQKDQHRDAIMRGTDLGQRIGELLQSINPTLRHQIMSSAMTSGGVSPEMLRDLVQLVDLEDVVSSLHEVNRRGDKIPATVFRTLSMMAHLESRDTDRTRRVEKAGTDEEPERDELKRMLDGLFDNDKIESYVSGQYQQIIDRLQARSEELARLTESRRERHHFALDDEEDHFIHVGTDLLARYPGDSELMAALEKEAGLAVVRELERGRVRQVQPGVALATGAREAAGGPGGVFEWERPDVLKPILARLESGGRWEGDDGVDVLVALGRSAVRPVVELLKSSDSITARKRALAALEQVDASPAAELLPLLDPGRPWFLQRNALYVLRKRGDKAGIPAAKRCWVESEPRVRAEILRYLIHVRDAESRAYVEAAMKSADSEDVLAAARVALEEGRFEMIGTIAERERAIGRRERGSDLHLGLLRLLASRGGGEGKAQVEEALRARAPILPWQARKFRLEVEGLLEAPR